MNIEELKKIEKGIISEIREVIDKHMLLLRDNDEIDRFEFYSIFLGVSVDIPSRLAASMFAALCGGDPDKTREGINIFTQDIKNNMITILQKLGRLPAEH